jgi:predicted RNase H-like HicB family nuclease
LIAAIEGATFEKMSYKVVVHAEPEGGFWAEVPALPGCVSQGETRAELETNIREAIEGYLAVLQEEGRAPAGDIEILEVAM